MAVAHTSGDHESPVQIVHLPGRARFEAHVRGRHAATLEYRISGPAAVLTHTDTPTVEDHPALATLIDAALVALVASGYYAVALCPHVRAFLQERPHRRAGVDARFVDPGPWPAGSSSLSFPSVPSSWSSPGPDALAVAAVAAPLQTG